MGFISISLFVLRRIANINVITRPLCRLSKSSEIYIDVHFQLLTLEPPPRHLCSCRCSAPLTGVQPAPLSFNLYSKILAMLMDAVFVVRLEISHNVGVVAIRPHPCVCVCHEQGTLVARKPPTYLRDPMSTNISKSRDGE